MAKYEPEIYSDLSYKPQLNQLGDATKLVNMDSIKQGVKTIVLTPPGSRLFEPTFGCGVSSLMFELIDDDTSVRVQRMIRNALSTYEPRILVNDVIVKVDADNSSIDIEINYFIPEIQEYDSVKIALAKL